MVQPHGLGLSDCPLFSPKESRHPDLVVPSPLGILGTVFVKVRELISWPGRLELCSAFSFQQLTGPKGDLLWSFLWSRALLLTGPAFLSLLFVRLGFLESFSFR